MRTVERRNKMKYDIRLDKKGNNQKKNHLNTSKLCHTDKLIDFYLSVWFDYAFLWAQHSIRFVRIRRRKKFDSRNIKTEKKNKRNCFSSYFSWFVPICTRFCALLLCLCLWTCAGVIIMFFVTHNWFKKQERKREREQNQWFWSFFVLFFIISII